MERPIILGYEGESREIVEEAGCGVGIEPENAKALAAAARRLAADPDLAREMGRRGKALVQERYDRKKLALTFADLLDDMIPPPDDRVAPTLDGQMREQNR